MFKWFNSKKYDSDIIEAFERKFYVIVIFGGNLIGNALNIVYKIMNLVSFKLESS